ncbi:MAG: PqqD family protein [Clostridia bacterium]|nr:PqqD family protein [Clostridia bacterium]
MRTNPDFILRQIAGENILVPCGEAAKRINGLINLNSTAAFIWKNLDETENLDALAAKVMEEFEVDEETAKRDVQGLTKELTMIGMVLAD